MRCKEKVVLTDTNLAANKNGATRQMRMTTTIMLCSAVPATKQNYNYFEPLRLKLHAITLCHKLHCMDGCMHANVSCLEFQLFYEQ